MTKPEVHVRSVRRRRSDPVPLPTPRPPVIRNWLIYAGLTALIAGLMLDGSLHHRPQHLPLPRSTYAVEVRSALAEVGDSLQVVVSWDLTLSEPSGRPDSVRIRVTPNKDGKPVMASQVPNLLADTVYLARPARGETLDGISCVAPEHGGVRVEESCTPWQYVRPSAATAASVNRIVIRPGGLQVDPDIGGRCAQWQRSHPGASVWLRVNETAVPECTGPNRKPAVAQFCAFAVLPDGKRVKTATSSNSPYCEELFVEWRRELYS
jgi:hypothetical protein